MSSAFNDLAQDLERIKTNREKRWSSSNSEENSQAPAVSPQFRISSDPKEVEVLLDEIRRRRTERKLYGENFTTLGVGDTNTGQPTQVTNAIIEDNQPIETVSEGRKADAPKSSIGGVSNSTFTNKPTTQKLSQSAFKQPLHTNQPTPLNLPAVLPKAALTLINDGSSSDGSDSGENEVVKINKLIHIKRPLRLNRKLPTVKPNGEAMSKPFSSSFGDQIRRAATNRARGWGISGERGPVIRGFPSSTDSSPVQSPQQTTKEDDNTTGSQDESFQIVTHSQEHTLNINDDINTHTTISEDITEEQHQRFSVELSPRPQIIPPPPIAPTMPRPTNSSPRFESSVSRFQPTRSKSVVLKSQSLMDKENVSPLQHHNNDHSNNSNTYANSTNSTNANANANPNPNTNVNNTNNTSNVNDNTPQDLAPQVSPRKNSFPERSSSHHVEKEIPEHHDGRTTRNVTHRAGEIREQEESHSLHENKGSPRRRTQERNSDRRATSSQRSEEVNGRFKDTDDRFRDLNYRRRQNVESSSERSEESEDYEEYEEPDYRPSRHKQHGPYAHILEDRKHRRVRQNNEYSLNGEREHNRRRNYDERERDHYYSPRQPSFPREDKAYSRRHLVRDYVQPRRIFETPRADSAGERYMYVKVLPQEPRPNSEPHRLTSHRLKKFHAEIFPSSDRLKELAFIHARQSVLDSSLDTKYPFHLSLSPLPSPKLPSPVIPPLPYSRPTRYPSHVDYAYERGDRDDNTDSQYSELTDLTEPTSHLHETSSNPTHPTQLVSPNYATAHQSTPTYTSSHHQPPHYPPLSRQSSTYILPHQYPIHTSPHHQTPVYTPLHESPNQTDTLTPLSLSNETTTPTSHEVPAAFLPDDVIEYSLIHSPSKNIISAASESHNQLANSIPQVHTPSQVYTSPYIPTTTYHLEQFSPPMPPLQISKEQVIISLLVSGTKLKRMRKKGVLQSCFFQVTPDLQHLQYSENKIDEKKISVSFADVRAVNSGQPSDKLMDYFAREDPGAQKNSLVVTVVADKTLEIVFNDLDDRKMWTRGLTLLWRKVKDRQAEITKNETKRNQSTIDNSDNVPLKLSKSDNEGDVVSGIEEEHNNHQQNKVKKTGKWKKLSTTLSLFKKSPKR